MKQTTEIDFSSHFFFFKERLFFNTLWFTCWCIGQFFQIFLISMSTEITPTEGYYRQYWLDISSVATSLETKDKFITAVVSGALAGGGALVGTLITPGLLTLVGGSMGLIGAAINAILLSQKHHRKRYTTVLYFTETQGVAYAHQLYDYFGKCLTHDYLKQYLSQSA